jgi:hypothetical protein
MVGVTGAGDGGVPLTVESEMADRSSVLVVIAAETDE